MKKQITDDDFKNQKLLGNLKVNNNETYGLFFMYQTDLENNTYRKSMHKIDLNNFKIDCLEIDNMPDDYYICFEQIICLYKQNDKLSVQTDLYTFDLKNNELAFLIKINGNVLNMEIYGDYLYYVIYDDQINNEGQSLTTMALTYSNFGSGPHKILCRVNLFNGERRVISPCGYDVDQVAFDIKHKCINFSAFKTEKIKPVTSYLFSFDVDRQVLKQITETPFRIEGFGSLTENSIVFKGVDLKIQSRNDNAYSYIVNQEDHICKRIENSNIYSVERPGVMSDHRFEIQNKPQVYDKTFYQIVVTRFSEKIQCMKEDLKIREIDTGLNLINAFVVLKKGILMIGAKENQFQELYFYDKTLTKITSVNEMDQSLILPCEYHSSDIDGWVIKPADYKKDKTYPAVLFIHGGPKTIYSAAYNHDMQLLAYEGYFVIFSNPRGSDGRGDAFANIKGSFGNMAWDDLQKFLNEIFDKYPAIDRERLGITGGSYGGYLTNYILAHSDLFKSAVSERGICNLSTSFLTSDIGYYFVKEYMGNTSTPWQEPSLYDEASPIRQAHLIKTPTSFNHGLSDTRCHYTESVMMYQALLYHGVDCELNLYDDEGHGFITSGKPLHRLMRHQKVISWFNRFLK